MRFLLVEDNQKLAMLIVERFVSDGHAIDWVDTLGNAGSYINATNYDLILLDLMLPDGDGRRFLARHRSSDRNTPVIVITARSQITDRVHILDLGADDYITKPFHYEELLARCRAVLRRQGGSATNRKRYGNVALDIDSACLYIKDRPVPLRNREMRLLEILFSSPNRIFPKSSLMNGIFRYLDQASENAIEVYIARLRKKLLGSRVSIETVRGLGYRLHQEDESASQQSV